ncbi:hypothetical protein Tco_0305196 [Tanacetum coccineum]
MGPTAIADNANVVLLCQQHSCGLCGVTMGKGLYYSLTHPTSLIPYPRFSMNHLSITYMDYLPDISRRRHKNKVGMQIPDWMITDEMKQTENYQMYTEVFGIDVPLTQRSRRLTPLAPVPTVDKADEMMLQDTLQLSLAEHKSHEEQEAKENVGALVDEQLHLKS